MSDDVFKEGANKDQRMRYCDMIEQLSLLNAQIQCQALAEVISQVDIDKLAADIDMLNPDEHALPKAEQDILIKARIDERKHVSAAEVETLRYAAEIIGRFASARLDDEDEGDDQDKQDESQDESQQEDEKQSPPLPDFGRGIWN